MNIHQAWSSDRNAVALRAYEQGVYDNDLTQMQIEDLTKELIATHSSDPDDMVAYMIDEQPETVAAILRSLFLFKTGNPYVAQAKIDAANVFMQAFLERKCEQLAEQAFTEERGM